MLAVAGFAQSVASVSVSAAQVVGSAGNNATVTLTTVAPTGGYVVNLTSSDPTNAVVPATVTVLAGATTANFAIGTVDVASDDLVTVTAADALSSASDQFTILAPRLSSISVTPSTVVGGTAAIGTVTLTSAAPTGGLTISLSSFNVASSVPASIVVPAGSTSQAFSVTTTPTASDRTGNIKATGAYGYVTTNLTVTAPVISSVTVNPTSVFGGAGSTGSVTISSAAPAGGLSISLASDSTSATVGATVTVSAGATTKTFPISTLPVATDATVLISATSGLSSASGTLTVKAPTLSSVVLSPVSLVGGNSSAGTVTIGTNAPTGGLVVNLSSNQSAASVPVSVSIPAGTKTTTFTVSTVAVAVNKTATVTASVNASTKNANLALLAPTVTSVSLSPTSAIGGNGSVGTVQISSPAPAGGFVVTLLSNKSSVTVPATVTIAAAATSGTFALTTIPVATDTNATITAKNAAVSQTATFTNLAPTVSSLTLSVPKVYGGTSVTGTVRLTGNAPAAGIGVHISSSNTYATANAILTISGGTNSRSFVISTTNPPSQQTATISATLGTTQSQTLIVNGLGLDLDSPWAQFRGNGAHTGLSNYAVASLDWNSTPGGAIHSSPSIGINGNAYVAAGNMVYAINPATGATLWSFATGGLVSSSPVITKANKLFVGSADGYLYAINAINGNLLWKTLTGGEVNSTPAISADGNVYFGSKDKKVYALSQADGSIAWSYTTNGPIDSSPTLGSDGILYVGSGDKSLYAINTKTGAKKWSFASGGVIHSSPALANGFIYFGSYDAKVYALNASNGTKVWSYLTQWIVHSSPCVDSHGNVYIGSDDSNLYSLKGATGTVNWATTLIEAIGSSPAVDLNGNLFVGDDDGIVYLLDTLTGWNIRRVIEGSIIDSSPVIVGNGQVIIGAQDGKLLRTTIH